MEAVGEDILLHRGVPVDRDWIRGGRKRTRRVNRGFKVSAELAQVGRSEGGTVRVLFPRVGTRFPVPALEEEQ